MHGDYLSAHLNEVLKKISHFHSKTNLFPFYRNQSLLHGLLLQCANATLTLSREIFSSFSTLLLCRSSASWFNDNAHQKGSLLFCWLTLFYVWFRHFCLKNVKALYIAVYMFLFGFVRFLHIILLVRSSLLHSFDTLLGCARHRASIVLQMCYWLLLIIRRVSFQGTFASFKKMPWIFVLCFFSLRSVV